MEAITQVIDADRLSSIFEIPEEMQHGRLEITIRSVSGLSEENSASHPKVNMEALERFRAGFNLKDHLKQKLAEGCQFDFDAQKVIDGTETEEERQARFRSEKKVWEEDVAERVKNGKSE
ncbi:hypothetical protein AGMMS50268_33820 [Spirochaetia bacterium]|nr:hypothetical protein AGMMS50268_33820 [Spirochaetia bacterium]